MRTIIFKNTILALFLGLILVACDKEDIARELSPRQESGSQVYFDKATKLSHVFTPLMEQEFEITLLRHNEAVAATVNLQAEDKDNKFTVPATVSFAAGEKEKKVKIGFSLEVGKSSTLVLGIPAGDEYWYGKERVTINVLRDYTWENIGTGTFTSSMFEKESGASWELPIFKAKEADLYRLKDLYYKGFNFDFTMTSDGTVTFGKQETGFVHSSYGMASFDPAGLVSSSANNVVTFNGKLVVAAGAFGIFQEVLFLPNYVKLVPTYKTDFSDDKGKAGWELDKFSGLGEDDDVWFFDMAKADAASLGTSIAAYYNGTPLRITSPEISVAEGDILSFGAYAGLFTPKDATPENAKVKIYIREVGGALDLNTPVKELDFLKGTKVSIPLTEYEGKKIKVIMSVEQSNFLFYHFAVATTDNAAMIFN